MSSQEGVSKQNVKQTKEDVTPMSTENLDVVQKSDLEALIEKAVGPLKTELTKANETIEAFKAKEKEQVSATRKAALKDAVKDEEKAEVLFKSFANLTDEEFTSTVETLKAMTTAGDAGELFTEKGVDAGIEEPAAKANATRTYLEKQYANK